MIWLAIALGPSVAFVAYRAAVAYLLDRRLRRALERECARIYGKRAP